MYHCEKCGLGLSDRLVMPKVGESSAMQINGKLVQSGRWLGAPEPATASHVLLEFAETQWTTTSHVGAVWCAFRVVLHDMNKPHTCSRALQEQHRGLVV